MVEGNGLTTVITTLFTSSYGAFLVTSVPEGSPPSRSWRVTLPPCGVSGRRLHFVMMNSRCRSEVLFWRLPRLVDLEAFKSTLFTRNMIKARFYVLVKTIKRIFS